MLLHKFNNKHVLFSLKVYARKPNVSRGHINKQTLAAHIYQILKRKKNTTNTMLEFDNSIQPKRNVLMQPQSSSTKGAHKRLCWCALDWRDVDVLSHTQL